MGDEENIQFLQDITPDSQNWRVKIIVISKLPWRTSESGKRYQKLILADIKGNAVDTVIFGSDIELYEDKLMQDKAYVISNAIVSKSDERYDSTFANTGYSWKINSRTNILQVERPMNVVSPYRKEFTTIDKCKTLVGKYIDTIVVIVEKYAIRNPKPNMTIREYVAIDQSLEPIIVTFWNDTMSVECYSYLDKIDQCPTVALIGFKVNTYKDTKTLSATRGSVVITQLDDERCSALKDWFITKKDDALMNVQSCEQLEKVRSAISKNDFAELTTKQLLDSDTRDKCFLNVNTTLEDIIKQKFIYICCELCHYQTDSPPNTMFYCKYCKVTKYARRRFRFQLVAEDSSGKLEITVFGEQGRKLFGMTEDIFNTKYTERTQIPKEEVNTILKSQPWRLLIKPKLYEPNPNTSIMYYNVDKWPGLMEDETAKVSGNIPTEVMKGCESEKMLGVDQSHKIPSIINVKIEEVEEAKAKAAWKARFEQTALTEETHYVQILDDGEDDNDTEGSRITRSRVKKRKAV